jgi:3-oxoacyl-[acyl-carrier-protein] synthase II
MSADAYHITSIAPEGLGAQRSMRAALKDAGIRPEEVGYINAHATATPAGDGNESQAIEAVFGEHALSHKLKISGTKSMHGHLLGAAGGLETIVAVMAVKTGKIPPTINVDHQDPECDLDVTANVAGYFDAEYAMNNGFGFGGTNGCLVLRKV